MKKTLISWLGTALSLLLVDLAVPNVDIANFPAALLAAVVIGWINVSIKPILFILSLPINILTLGAFSLVINGFCFWLASVLVPGFLVQGLLAFILGPIVLSLANTVISQYFTEKEMSLSDNTKA